MVLGEKLRSAMERLRTAALLDKGTIREAIKDIQRALIAADVDINLVGNLSSEIEKRALEKPPAGISRREFTIKKTHDLLAELLGGHHSPPQKPRRILLLGLFGQGKCIDGKSKITLSDGRIEEIEKIFGEYSDRKARERDGFRIPLSGELSVPSLNPKTLLVENKEVEAIWKLKKRDCLIEVSVDNGNNQKIKVTPEHPFFVLEGGVVKQVRADRLKEGNFIAMPYSLPNLAKRDIDLTKEIEKLELRVLDDFGLREKIKERALRKFGTLKEAHKNKRIRAPYCGFSHELKNAKFVRSEHLRAFDVELPKREFVYAKAVQSDKPVRLPTALTEELNLLLGYFVGDGHLSTAGIEFFSADKEVVKKIENLSIELFGLCPKVEKDKRSKTLRRVRINSVLLRDFFSKVFGFPVGKKSATVKLNNLILCQNNKNLSSFLQAYFDCDGSVYGGERTVEATTASEELAFQLQQMLLRFGISATYSRKKVKNRDYYRLTIRSTSAEKFSERIGSIMARKRERLEEVARIGERQGSGKTDMLPIGTKLRTARELFGQTIGEIQQTVNSYGMYEKKGIISRNSLKKMLQSLKSKENKNWLKILKAVKEGKNTYVLLRGETKYSIEFLNAILFRIQQQGLIRKVVSPNPGEHFVLSRSGRMLLGNGTGEREFEELQKLANSGVFWPKVAKIKKIKPKKWVYDLTVKDNHNFVANGIIVHNTTTAAKLAQWYKKRGSSVALICADVHRPASFEQLQQLAEQAGVEYYGDKKEKNAAKIVERGLKEMKKHDLTIVDSAGRSALDKKLVDEIKEVKSVFQPEQTWLVLSADIGQLAKKQAQAFHSTASINGIIISKVDGSAKGGGALAACAETRSPVYFIGTGEKLPDLQEFDAQRYLGLVMGYGDLQGLLQRAREVTEEEEFSPQDLLSGEFTLKAFYKQLEAAKKMGPISKVAEMMGLKAQLPKEQLELGQEKLDSFKVLMDSMTEQELRNPSIINRDRIRRIARGSGKTEAEVRELLKHYRQTSKFLEKFKKLGKGKDLKDLDKLDVEKLMKKFSRRKTKKLRFR